MGISAGVQDNAIRTETHLLQLVDDLPLHITLEIFNLRNGKFRPELRDKGFKAYIAIYSRLPYSGQVKVWPVDDAYFHKEMPALQSG